MGCSFIQLVWAMLIAREIYKKPFHLSPTPPHYDHNYDGSSNYNSMIYNFMDIQAIPTGSTPVGAPTIIPAVEYMAAAFHDKPDVLDKLFGSKTWNNYKRNFWTKHQSRIETLLGEPTKNKLLIGVHVRRQNSHDDRLFGSQTPLSVYKKVISHILKQYQHEEAVVHLYSQGHSSQFLELIEHASVNSYTLQLHLDESVIDSFLGMMGCNHLIMGTSAYSYISACLSRGRVWYMPFWTPPLSTWTSCACFFDTDTTTRPEIIYAQLFITGQCKGTLSEQELKAVEERRGRKA